MRIARVEITPCMLRNLAKNGKLQVRADGIPLLDLVMNDAARDLITRSGQGVEDLLRSFLDPPRGRRKV
jgi:hypothetical protein